MHAGCRIHWDHISCCYAGIWAAREVDGAGSMELGVTSAAAAAVSITTTSGWGSFSEYGGAGKAAMPMGLDSIVGDGRAAAVGVVKLHIRITSS